MTVSAAPEPTEAVSFGNLLRAWGDAGEAPPASIVASILHDLAEEGASAERPADDVDVDAIWIHTDGRAVSEAPLAVAALAELMDLGLSGVVPGRTGDLMPPAARGGIDRFRAWDGTHEDGCVAFAGWLREHFGPLPGPEEVARCARASAPLDPQAPTMLPTRARSEPDLAAEPQPREALSEAPDPAPVSEAPPLAAEASDEALEVPEEVSSDSHAPTTLGSAHPADLGEPVSEPLLASRAREPLPSMDVETPAPPSEEEATATGSMDLSDVESSGERPVVRKELPSRRERTVSVVSAPAARRSARPLTDRGDSILVPAEGGKARGWILLLIGVAIAVGLYFLLTPA